MKTRMRPRIGYVYAALNAVISGIAIFVNSALVHVQFHDAAVYTTVKNGVVGVMLGIALLSWGPARRELRRLSGRMWIWMVAIALVSGSVPFLLDFTGMQMTSAVTAALLNHLMFAFVAVLAFAFLRERVPAAAWIALGALLAGTVLGVDTRAVQWNAGAALIVVATGLYAAGWVMIKHVLRQVSLIAVLWARMGLGTVFLLGYLAATGRLAAVAALGATQWLAVLLTGTILLLFNVTILLALRHASVTAVTAIGMGAPVVTLLLTALSGRAVSLSGPDSLGLAFTFAAVVAIYAFGRSHEDRRLEEGAAS